jgi:hypothetical protein
MKVIEAGGTGSGRLIQLIVESHGIGYHGTV